MFGKQHVLDWNKYGIIAMVFSIALLMATFVVPKDVEAAARPVSCEHYHYVQQGEHIASIAAHYNVSYDNIAADNGLPYPYYLNVGQRLCINGATLPMSQAPPAHQSPAPQAPQSPQATSPLPTPTPYTPPPAQQSGGHGSGAHGQASQAPAPSHAQTMPNPSQHRPPVQQQQVNYSCSYIVLPGDSLHRIARHYGITARKLARANHLRNINRIYVGQHLTVPCVS